MFLTQIQVATITLIKKLKEPELWAFAPITSRCVFFDDHVQVLATHINTVINASFTT